MSYYLNETRVFKRLGVSSTSSYTRAPMTRTLPVYTPSLVSCSITLNNFLTVFSVCILMLYFWHYFYLPNYFDCRGRLLRLYLARGAPEKDGIHNANHVSLIWRMSMVSCRRHAVTENFFYFIVTCRNRNS